jgi:hypothetical protein
LKILRLFGAVCFIIFAITSSGYSQERFQIGLNFTLGYPQGEFNKNLDSSGLGASGYFTYRLPKTPISIGASAGILVYGSDTREDFLQSSIPEVMVDVTTRNYILNCHFLLRVQPFDGQFRPYLDGLIGFNYLWTETGIYDQSGGVFDEIASSVNLSDFAFSYGVGGGFMVSLYQREKSAFAICVDSGIRYLKGGNAEYLKEGDIIRQDGELIYNVSYSKTDLFTVHIGVVFSF